MIGFPHSFAPELLRALGLSLLHFLWQGAALAALSAGGSRKLGGVTVDAFATADS